MNNSNKHRRILILMISSLLLLTILVLHWLRTQYRNEKAGLENELTGFYLDAQDEIVDTLLYKSYVNPVLSITRRGKNQQLIALKDTSVSDTVFIAEPGKKENVVRLKGTREAITVRVEHGGDSVSRIPDTLKIRQMNEDVLMRSVKLIVSHTSDTSGSAEPVMKKFRLKPDTSAFKLNFEKKLQKAGMKFNLTWDDSKIPVTSLHKKSALHLDTLNPFGFPAASVTGYGGYLTRRILPQILFGLVLMIVTGFAFGISYRSISEHILLNDLRNEFISNMTHELKTPVATISVALESLRKYNIKNEPAVMDEYLKLAAVETKRLEELINRILDHSMLEENSRPLSLVLTDINRIIPEVADIMRPRLEEGGKIEVLLSSEKINAMADPLFLKGVIINLVDNSIKYCEKLPFIRIMTRKENGFAVIEVNDNGPGIPQEFRNKIFEKFFRLPLGNVHNVKGYGLGLSFASLVMKLHNGSIGVINHDIGCSFIIKIPAA